MQSSSTAYSKKARNSANDIEIHVPAEIAQFVKFIESKKNVLIVHTFNATREEAVQIRKCLDNTRNKIIVR